MVLNRFHNGFAAIIAMALMLVFAGASGASARIVKGHGQSQSQSKSIEAALQQVGRLQKAGDYKRARIYRNRAIRLAASKYGRDSLQYARVLERLAAIYRASGLRSQASRLLALARKIRSKALAAKPKTKPRVHPVKVRPKTVPPKKTMPKSYRRTKKDADDREEAAPEREGEGGHYAQPAPTAAPVAPTAAPKPLPRSRSLHTRGGPFGVRGHKKDAPYTTVEVFYATDRDQLASDKWRVAYGVERSSVTYGTCEVSIPKGHKPGKLEAPSIWKLEFSENPKKHVVLMAVNTLDKDAYFNRLKASISQSQGKNAFIFVHGFNVTFEDAARRTAQMAFDLGFDGAPVFYSWPSKGSVASYMADQTTVRWAENNLLQFLRDFVAKSDADNIYLVAHSMGNRALTGAVSTLVDEQPEMRKRFREIILAAPDIDADVFKRDIAPRMIEASNNVTLYVSADDRALQASRKIHESPRAGEAGDNIIIMKGIDTIDATGLDCWRTPILLR